MWRKRITAPRFRPIRLYAALINLAVVVGSHFGCTDGMTAYTETQVLHLFDQSLKEAAERLKGLTVCCVDQPAFAGLSGWVFEQTIHYCIRRELEARQLPHLVKDMVRLRP